MLISIRHVESLHESFEIAGKSIGVISRQVKSLNTEDHEILTFKLIYPTILQRKSVLPNITLLHFGLFTDLKNGILNQG